MKLKSISSKRILITGGTGSFGTYILKELTKINNFKEIIVFSRDEDRQFNLKQQYSNYNNIKFEIGDVRDLQRVREVCKGIDIIFNAAALKQVPNNEFNPYEVILTNIIGAKNIVTASIENNVEKVIGISTDKAVKPVNAMGMTKALQEKLFTAESTNRNDTKFCCVRYGNVIGSRGSVIPFFKELILRDKKLPITHSEMTRFLLTLKNAIDLVMFAVANLRGGEIFVRKSPSCKITMLAEVMYNILKPKQKDSKKSLYYIAGKRPGEKIHEILISEDEGTNRVDDKINYYIVNPFWKNPTYSEIKEYSSNPVTITSHKELQDLLKTADNLSWKEI